MYRGLAALALAACSYSFDYSSTMYRCPDGVCPSGFQCVSEQCVKSVPGDGSADTPVDTSGPPPCTTALAVAHEHVCTVIASTGAMLCWGHGNSGELGNNAAADTSTVQTVLNVTNASAISVGGRATHAVKAGLLFAFGADGQSQLGDGGTTDQHVPISVAASITNWKDVGDAARGACGLRMDGTVMCWGCTTYLADPSVAPHCMTTQPLVTAVSLPAAATQLSVGHAHACALLADNTVWCWGRNDLGQLGDGTMTDATTPVKAMIDGVSQVAAGRRHTCAIKAGQAYCWGSGSDGQQGDGQQVTHPTPTLVPGLSGVTQLSAGGWYTCALAGGQAWCWGDDTKGQLGDGPSPTFLDQLSPVMVQGLHDPVLEIRAGTQVTCARDALGVECWGANTRGQLGQGGIVDTTPHPVPVAVPLGCP